MTPLTTNYRGWEVYEIPPNSQGIAALIMLNILENFPLGDYGRGTAETLHTLIEAKKLAYADMQRHVGDPRFSKVPVEALLSKAYARERAGLIDPRRAATGAAAGTLPTHGGDTTYLCAVDAAGNVASLIQSNFANFGSGVVPDGAGFVLQSRGGLFTFDRSHPNALAPRKRPLQTVIPAFMKRDHVRVGFGVMGGWNQPQAHVQVISNMVDHGLNIQQALEAPRFVKLTFAGTDVMMEARFPAACSRRPGAPRPRDRSAGGVLEHGGRRTGGDARPARQGELRRIRSAQGRRRDSGADPVIRFACRT